MKKPKKVVAGRWALRESHLTFFSVFLRTVTSLTRSSKGLVNPRAGSVVEAAALGNQQRVGRATSLTHSPSDSGKSGIGSPLKSPDFVRTVIWERNVIYYRRISDSDPLKFA